MSIKHSLNHIDETLLKDFIYASQISLNDIETSEMVSAETGFSIDRLNAIAGVLIELSTLNGEKPSITTTEEFNQFVLKIKGERLEVEQLQEEGKL